MSHKETYEEHLYALIVAGGGGTRLWPRSRNATPKQFLKLFNNQTLTQITSVRLNKFIPWSNIFVVTVSEAYKKEVTKQVPQIPIDNILVEPARKNTAPAHGLGALYIYKKDHDAVIVNAAADHLVTPVDKYINASKAAAKAAFSGNLLVALGIKPTYPNVGYGHIKKGVKFAIFEGKTLYKVDKFVEKPPLPLAIKYTKSGNYYWNANQYVWRADTYLTALKKYEPLLGTVMDSIFGALGTPDEKKVIQNQYKIIPDTTTDGKDLSIDYAVSERADNFLVLPVDYNWTDIGDWNEVWENLDKDDSGNVIIDGDEPGGRVISLDTSNTIVHSDGRLIVIIDVDDVAVVDTKNAVLICSKSKAQNVKKIVEQLKYEKKLEYL